VDVDPVNDPPRANTDSVRATGGTTATFNVLANDVDVDGDEMRIVGWSIVVGSGTLDRNGTAILYRPRTDLVGTDTARYEVCDPTGLCDTATIVISIIPVNDAPSFDNASQLTVDEDAGPVTVPGWASNISAGPADEASQIVTFTVTSDRPSLFVVAPSVDPAGTLRFVTAPNANGQATIRVIARDNGGTALGGIDVSSTHDATVTVTPVNDPVVAVNDTASVNEDDPAGVTFAVLTNDSDVDGDALAIASTDTSAISNGMLTALGGGRFHYLPDPNFNGTESFSYVVSDGHGSLATAGPNRRQPDSGRARRHRRRVRHGREHTAQPSGTRPARQRLR
jgi:hypothetical protein